MRMDLEGRSDSAITSSLGITKAQLRGERAVGTRKTDQALAAYGGSSGVVSVLPERLSPEGRKRLAYLLEEEGLADAGVHKNHRPRSGNHPARDHPDWVRERIIELYEQGTPYDASKPDYSHIYSDRELRGIPKRSVAAFIANVTRGTYDQD